MTTLTLLHDFKFPGCKPAVSFSRRDILFRQIHLSYNLVGKKLVTSDWLLNQLHYSPPALPKLLLLPCKISAKGISSAQQIATEKTGKGTQWEMSCSSQSKRATCRSEAEIWLPGEQWVLPTEPITAAVIPAGQLPAVKDLLQGETLF